MQIPEKSLIVILLDKESYNSYKEEIDLEFIKDNFRELSYIYNTLISLHEKHDLSFTLSELEAAFYSTYPESSRQTYDAIFESLRSITIDPAIGHGILDAIRRKKALLKLSETAFRAGQGLIEYDELETYWNNTFAESGEASGGETLPLTAVSDDLETLIENAYSEQGLRWRLDCLNKSLGSLREGDFGFIFARPETGKTTFLASEITAFLGRTTNNEVPIIWFNNEEQGHKVMLRVYQAYFGVTLEQLLANPKSYKHEFLGQTEGRFRLFDSATISRRDIERIVSRLNPQLVIYDQIDKIKGFNNDREDLRLGSIYQWARELAKGSHASIGVCQADGHAEGVRYLTMEHVSNAKTSKQAEADFILGIGKTNDQESEYVRYINISKNKLMGDKDSISSLRHGRFETIIRPDIARYDDVIKFD